jgi:hypothetical protein
VNDARSAARRGARKRAKGAGENLRATLTSPGDRHSPHLRAATYGVTTRQLTCTSGSLRRPATARAGDASLPEGKKGVSPASG